MEKKNKTKKKVKDEDEWLRLIRGRDCNII